MLAGIVAKLLGRGLFVAGLVLVVGLPAPAQASLSFSAPSTVDRNAANRLRAVACPSASQCTAVDETGQQVTFNPASPGSPTPTAIDSYVNLFGVSCPSTTQCTAVDGGGREVTFNPTSPGTPTAIAIGGGSGLSGVACPLTTQCTAVDDSGYEITFDPTSPGTPTATAIDGTTHNLDGVACPSTTQCTAVDFNAGMRLRSTRPLPELRPRPRSTNRTP